MSPTDWATLSAAVATTAAFVLAGIKWLVKHYLAELKPNSGSSLRDSVNRLEKRVDEIFTILLEKK